MTGEDFCQEQQAVQGAENYPYRAHNVPMTNTFKKASLIFLR